MKNAGSFNAFIQVREYFLGTSMPVVKSAEVVRVEYSTDEVINLEVSCNVQSVMIHMHFKLHCHE